MIVELGYFTAHLGRQHVCALVKGDVEVPSDFSGVVFVPFDANGGWKNRFARELDEVGYNLKLVGPA